MDKCLKKDIRYWTDDPEWQKIRLDLIGKWRDNYDYCIGRLEKYINDVTKASDGHLCRVYNYLTGSGFRTGRIPLNARAEKLKDLVSAEIAKRSSKK